MARPPPAPIADPISAFRPRWPLRFTWTVLISARDSVSCLAAALIASASGIAFSRLPRTVLPPDRATRISVPGATWLRLAHPSGDAGGWAGAFPARPANSNTTILNFIIGLVIESGHFTRRSTGDQSYHQVVRSSSRFGGGANTRQGHHSLIPQRGHRVHPQSPPRPFFQLRLERPKFAVRKSPDSTSGFSVPACVVAPPRIPLTAQVHRSGGLRHTRRVKTQLWIPAGPVPACLRRPQIIAKRHSPPKGFFHRYPAAKNVIRRRKTRSRGEGRRIDKEYSPARFREIHQGCLAGRTRSSSSQPAALHRRPGSGRFQRKSPLPGGPAIRSGPLETAGGRACDSRSPPR